MRPGTRGILPATIVSRKTDEDDTPIDSANHATVRRTLVRKKKVPNALSILDNVCAAGAQCSQVQGSVIASQALIDLKAAVTTATTSLTSQQALAQALRAAIKTLKLDYGSVEVALDTYQTAVNALAKGDASIINKAGLLSRGRTVVAVALGKVTVVHTKPGQHPGEAILSWPVGPGATSYAIEVNFTPQVAGSVWTALGTGSARHRVVKGPAPGAQFLARVASVDSDGVASDWSDEIMATAL